MAGVQDGGDYQWLGRALIVLVWAVAGLALTCFLLLW